MVVLNGKVAFLWWLAVSDAFNVTQASFKGVPFGLSHLTAGHTHSLVEMVPRLKEAMESKLTYKPSNQKLLPNYNLALCRDVTDQSDRILLDALDLSDLWDDIELEYSHVVRTEFARK